MKIGFIGCGNMAGAIIKGLLNDNSKTSIGVYDISDCAVKNILSYNSTTKAFVSSSDVIKNSDVVILAVKPGIIASVLTDNRDIIDEYSPLIVSIAAGKKVEYIESFLTDSARVIRVMPNINAMVLEAMSGYCCNKNVTANDTKTVESIFSAVGSVMAVDESLFPLYSVIAGCSPAYAYMFIDSMARSAVKSGMNKNTALKIAAQSVLGSAKMILESEESPWALIDKVCSPGGTTIEGVLSLQSDGFESAVNNAINKALDKDSKI